MYMGVSKLLKAFLLGHPFKRNKEVLWAQFIRAFLWCPWKERNNQTFNDKFQDYVSFTPLSWCKCFLCSLQSRLKWPFDLFDELEGFFVILLPCGFPIFCVFYHINEKEKIRERMYVAYQKRPSKRRPTYRKELQPKKIIRKKL